MKEPLDIAIDPRGVCQLTLNRPGHGNSLDGELVQKLSAAFAQVCSDSEIRLVVLTGQGAVFCSGADLQWMQQMADADAATNKKDAFELALMLDELAKLPVPTIARVNGSAFGGAIGLICACDIAIASNEANFTFSEVRLGLMPAVIAPYVIAAMGLRQTRRWFLSGETMSSKQARQLGLVHQLVAADGLDDGIEQQIQLLLMGGPKSQKHLKGMMHEWFRQSSYSKEGAAELLAEIRASDEGREGLNAFLEKREPRWSR